MKTIKKTLFIQARTWNIFPDDEMEICIYEGELESCETFTYLTLGTTEVEIEIDDSNLQARMVNAKIESLQQAKLKILADSQVKANNIEEQISKLQAIESKEIAA